MLNYPIKKKTVITKNKQTNIELKNSFTEKLHYAEPHGKAKGGQNKW